MTGLLRAEVLRVVSRRFLRVLALIIVGLLLVQAVVAFFESSSDPDAGLQQARAEIERCERDRAEFIEQEGADAGWTCPTVEEVRPFYDPRFRYAETMQDVFTGIGIMFLAVGLIIGASTIGAEWGSGSMTTLLAWEPRRHRVMAAKWGSAAVIATGFFVFLLILIVAVFYPVALARGTTDGASRSFWWTQLGLAARDLGLGVFGVTAGVALATLFRSTAGAIGFGFFYGAIGDFLLGVWRDGFLADWLLRENIARLLGTALLSDAVGELPVTLSAVRPAVLLTIYGLGLLGVAFAVFQRRDVT